MKKLALLRHSQSLWNLENKFTGWTDVDLSDQGIREAHKIGKVLKVEGYTFKNIIKLEILTGVPLIYELDNNIHAITRYYLFREDTV